jgi:hypothetical protein
VQKTGNESRPERCGESEKMTIYGEDGLIGELLLPCPARAATAPAAPAPATPSRIQPTGAFFLRGAGVALADSSETTVPDAVVV